MSHCPPVHGNLCCKPRLCWLARHAMKPICTATLAVSAGTGLAHAQAAADSDSSFHWSGRIEATTDNRERGISNSANRPSVRLVAEMLHSSGVFAEFELTRVSTSQYPGGRGLRAQLNGGYRFGDPEGWQFELGAQHSRLPGARQPGGQGYALVFDAELGEVVDAKLLPASVSFTTTEAFAGVRHGPVSLKYFHTLSRDFFGISGLTVCPSVGDLAASFACFERGAQHSRSSQYLELELVQRLSKSATLAVRLGHQRVRNWQDFNTRSFAVELRHTWRSFDLTLALTGAKPRLKGAYDVQLSDNRVRDSTKTAAVLTAGYAF